MQGQLGSVAGDVADLLKLEGVGQAAGPAQDMSGDPCVEISVNCQPLANVVVSKQVGRAQVGAGLGVEGKEVYTAHQTRSSEEDHVADRPGGADTQGGRD